jgi:hypothetical protein
MKNMRIVAGDDKESQDFSYTYTGTNTTMMLEDEARPQNRRVFDLYNSLRERPPGSEKAKTRRERWKNVELGEWNGFFKKPKTYLKDALDGKRLQVLPKPAPISGP